MAYKVQEKPEGCYIDLDKSCECTTEGQALPQSGKKRGLRQSLNLFEHRGYHGRQATHAVANMPPLTWEEALEWLCAAPGVKQLVFNAATASGLVAYDKTTGRWHGCEVNPATDPITVKEQRRTCQ